MATTAEESERSEDGDRREASVEVKRDNSREASPAGSADKQ